MNHPHISVKQQAALLELNRTSAYRPQGPQKPPERDVLLMHEIDKVYTDHPTYGYRTITAILKSQMNVDKKRVRRLMRKMGIYAIYPKPNLSKRFHAQHTRPYLLSNLPITRPNQVWGIDITYVKMGKGFMYLFVIIDWYSRFIVDYELSSTLEKGFVMTCLSRALSNAKPEIINSDQGSHFTNPDYIALLERNGVKISMDGKGRATDNARTERFFRTYKYDCIYTWEYETPRALRKATSAYIREYNRKRPHQALNYSTPVKWYHENNLQEAA